MNGLHYKGGMLSERLRDDNEDQKSLLIFYSWIPVPLVPIHVFPKEYQGLRLMHISNITTIYLYLYLYQS